MALDSWHNIYVGLSYPSKESMVLSRPQRVFLYYLEISLTVLQNYRITAFVNLRLTPLKELIKKIKQQQQENR